jgi:hypothetical protein
VSMVDKPGPWLQREFPWVSLGVFFTNLQLIVAQPPESAVA